MTTIWPRRNLLRDKKLQPVCLREPKRQQQLPRNFKGPLFVLIVFIFLLIPFIPGRNTPLPTFKPSFYKKSEFLPSLDLELLNLIHTNDGGFAFILRAGQIVLVKTNKSGMIQWSHELNVDYRIRDPKLIQTNDGGFIFAYILYENLRIIKMDFKQNIEWNQSYSFRNPPRNFWDIELSKLLQTIDGGFVFLLKDKNYDITSYRTKQIVLKIDKSGIIQWQKEFINKNKYDYPGLTDIIQTADNGYILTGLDVQITLTPQEFPSSTDIWLIKLDKYGDSLWDNHFELVQNKWIQGCHIIQTSDKGFAITTELDRYLEKTSESVQSWLIKTDSLGKLEWKEDLSLVDITAPIQTSEDCFVIAGTTLNILDENNSSNDITVIKLCHNNIFWKKTFGNMGIDDKVVSLVQTHDQGYAIASYSETASITKLDIEGEIMWSQKYYAMIGDTEWTNTVIETNDKGFALAGLTSSYGRGPTDMWLIKTNEFGFEKWSQVYGGNGDEVANAMIQTKDGDFVVAGSTTSYGNGQSDMWLIKIDPLGSLKWNHTYGTEGKDLGYYLEETIDGGFAIMGVTYSNDNTSGELLLVKTDASGTMQWYQTYDLQSNFTLVDQGIHEYYAHGDHTDEYFYGKSILTRVISFIETNDGGFAFFFPYNQLLKTDKYGVVQWRKKLNLGFVPIWSNGELGFNSHFVSHNRVCFKESTDNGFILGITNYVGGMCCSMAKSDGYEGILLKTNAEGIIQWKKEYRDDGYLKTIDAIYPIDDGIIAWIWSYNYYNITKIGLDGICYWNITCLCEEQAYYPVSYSHLHISGAISFDSILTSNGEYVTTGIANTGGYPFYFNDAFLVKRASNGGLVWWQTYGSTGGFRVVGTPPTNSPTLINNSSINKFDNALFYGEEINNDKIVDGFKLPQILIVVVFLKWIKRGQKKGKCYV